MGHSQQPANVKLICGLLTGDAACVPRVAASLAEHFGEIDETTGPWSFDCTRYYEREMGPGLLRYFFSFVRLVAPDYLVDAKLATNELESVFAHATRASGPARPINLDPGYLALDKLVLATTKNHAHRVYVGRGIFAEVTLRYEDHRWQPWPWTYPDYSAETYHEFLVRVRDRLRHQFADESNDHTATAVSRI